MALGKKYKEKYKVKDRTEEKPRDGKDRGRDFERQREKRDKPRYGSGILCFHSLTFVESEILLRKLLGIAVIDFF